MEVWLRAPNALDGLNQNLLECGGTLCINNHQNIQLSTILRNPPPDLKVAGMFITFVPRFEAFGITEQST